MGSIGSCLGGDGDSDQAEANRFKFNCSQTAMRELIIYHCFLGVIDNAGVPTEEFDNLKKDYQPTLRRLVQEKYSELLSFFPLAKINQARLVSYFGQPVETAEYQAKFFVWLCEQAGIELPNVEKKFHRARFDKKNE